MSLELQNLKWKQEDLHLGRRMFIMLAARLTYLLRAQHMKYSAEGGSTHLLVLFVSHSAVVRVVRSVSADVTGDVTSGCDVTGGRGDAVKVVVVVCGRAWFDDRGVGGRRRTTLYDVGEMSHDVM